MGALGTSAAGVDRRFARLWGSTAASSLGTGLVTIAAPLLVATWSTDPLVVASSFAVAWLPWLLFALPGGVLVDRVDRRRLLVVLDVVRAAALLALAAAVVGGAEQRAGTAVLFAVLFVVNGAEVVSRTAGQTVVPDVVGSMSLERANGWLFGTAVLMNGVLAAPLAGFLFALAAGAPFGVAAAAMVVGALLLAALPGTYRAARPARGTSGSGAGTGPVRTVLGEVGEAFAWLVRQRVLRTMALLIGLLNLTFTAALALLVLVAQQRLGLGPVGYGVLVSCMAVGGIAGAAAGDRVIAWATPTWTVRIGLLVEAGMHLALAWSTSTVVVAVALVAFGVHGSLWGIVGTTLRQRLTPPEMLGRVGSATLFTSAGGNCVGALLGGLLAQAAGLTAPYWVGFVLALAVTAATWHVFSQASMAQAHAPSAGRA
ncbi:MFS transporter [Quadrisphaera sp. INWT6]|uniref:MFS transporter n=1 Tax=Quadrisphaera sp. INWT6 TaxID=2596917 RepID=UPI001891F630|nr:MFS transporter [Quadrisphaera sp. INWT6]MBF5082535.1 MFS transporter [Quadrisphaera sp. INWT6]